MRILPAVQRKEVLREVCDYARKNTKFQLPDCDVHVQVIPGETEGLYGWIAANYLLGGFNQPQDHDHGKGHNTYGFLDMGGASAQIAFAPNATEAEKHANDLTLMRLRTVGGTPLEYKVFVTTWLGFGVNQARQRYVKALIDSTSSKELPDPCLPAGLEVEVTKDGKFIELDSDDDDDDEEEKPAAKLHGTGKFQECLHQTFPLLEKEKECLDEPCLLNGQHVPAIDFDVNHFVGVSEYWHTTHEIFQDKHKDKAYDFKTYQQHVSEFCNQDWKHILKGVDKGKWGKKVDEEKAREVCFKASWIINMLHDGIGVPRVGLEPLPSSSHNTTSALLSSAKDKGFLDPFQAVDKINNVELSWTLGKMVLYASSEIPPPSPTALAVGFGANEPGTIPKNFQYPGGSYLPWQHDPLDDSNWHRLFSEYPSRIPALLIFIVIIAVIIGIVLGKEKRAILRSHLAALFRRKQGKAHPPVKGKRRGFLPSKLFNLTGGAGAAGQSYERVDAAEAGLSANDFELEETYLDSSDEDQHFSDSSNGSRARVGRSSGWATPQMKSAADQGYFNASAGGLAEGGAGAGGITPGLGTALGLNAIERGGLLARTDSRERIRSRASSPKRGRSKMGSLDE